MWSQTKDHTPGQSQGVHHDQASMMAHAAARKAAVMRMLQGGQAPSPSLTAGAPSPTAPAAPPPMPGPAPAPSHLHSFKAHVAAAGAAQGVPLGMADIHGAIDGLTQAGHFTPGQGAALKAHNGPLHGKAGASTMHAITQAAVAQAPKP